MRSRPDTHLLCLVALTALLAVAPAVRADAAPQQSTATSETPGPADVARAIDTVKKDPNFAPERTIKVLRWKKSDARRSGRPAWLTWIAGLAEWIGQSARVLVWCAAFVLAGMLVVYIARLFHTHGVPRREDRFVAPTHVRDLDIRPETLPADIGAAARALWDRGDHRASLALLYRGLLSRLVHVHRLSIRDSSTEGDCLTLVAQHLTQARREYASLLITAWQRSVYGREQFGAATVHALCDDFAPVLDCTGGEAIEIEGAA